MCRLLKTIMGDRDRPYPPERDAVLHRWDREQFKELLKALNKGGAGDQSAVLAAINQVKEIVMGLKEDYDALSARFDTLDEATQLIADDIAALKEEIRIANENSNVDLSALVTRAESIETRLRGSAGSVPGSGDE